MRTPNGRRNHRWILPILAVLGTLVLSGIPSLVSAATAPTPVVPQIIAGPGIIKLLDQQSVSHLFTIKNVTLRDSVGGVFTSPFFRLYTIDVTTTKSNRTLPVLLETQPTNFWSGPGQLPNGADNLPPLSEWSWWVTTPGGVNDTQNWSVDPTGVWLTRVTSWTPQGYTVYGRSNPVINVSVTPTAPDGSIATGGGFVLNAGGFPYSVPTAVGYPAMVSTLHPSFLRFSVATGQTFASWNSSSKQPGLSFTGFDTLYSVAAASGADVLLSLPAGNWGDGNVVPNGTPINRSVGVAHGSMTGFFFTPAVMYALVRQIANHTYATGETITYWSVGNEVPLNGTTEVTAYVRLINAAIRAAHVLYPSALVGTDNMLSTTYLAAFAKYAPKVGFLSFHYYPAWGMCVNATGQYCPPTGQPNGTTTPTLFSRTSYWHGANSQTYMPGAGQWAWYNLTGNWLPVLNTETNLGATGGPGGPTWTVGPDPRIPDLTGAAWLGSMLIDSSEQNVSNVGYFTLTSIANISGTSTTARGGFGFGVTNVSPAGKITFFAPYYVMQLWNQYIPHGAVGLTMTDSDYASVRAYAVLSAGHVEVALASRVGVPVNVHLSVAGHFTLQQVTVLDSNSYSEQYNATQNMTSVVRSGVSVTVFPASSTVTIHGYGFALAQFALISIQSPRTTNTSGELAEAAGPCVSGRPLSIAATASWGSMGPAPLGIGAVPEWLGNCGVSASGTAIPAVDPASARLSGPMAIIGLARSSEGARGSRARRPETRAHAPARSRRRDRFHRNGRDRPSRPAPHRSGRLCRRSDPSR